MLKIIAGKYKSRIINQPPKSTTRPTINRAREAIFSSIQFSIENKKFLDLFSGSSSFCLEALSRGAKLGVSIEKDYEAYLVSLENKSILGENNLFIFNTDAISYLNKIVNEKFDYIYLDPPYKIFNIINNCLEIIFSKKVLNKDGIIIIETNKKTLELNNPSHYQMAKTKKYGNIYIYYLKYINNL